jgi:hypothetical protein
MVLSPFTCRKYPNTPEKYCNIEGLSSKGTADLKDFDANASFEDPVFEFMENRP